MAAKNKSNELKISRLFDAPLQAVWDAWTNPPAVGVANGIDHAKFGARNLLLPRPLTALLQCRDQFRIPAIHVTGIVQ